MENYTMIQSHVGKLSLCIHYPEKNKNEVSNQTKKFPVILICHGFIGNKIGVDRLFVESAREFCKQGYLVVRFDYGGCGESDGNYGNHSIEDLLLETKILLEFVYTLKEADQDRVTLLGHSLGGAVASLTASIDHRINRLILWSAVAHPFKDI